LIDQALQGNQQAFRQLWQHYHRHLYFIIYRMVRNAPAAEDLTAEAFAKAFAHLPRFRKEYSFSAWLFRICINLAFTHLRRRKTDTLRLSYLTLPGAEADGYPEGACPAYGPEEQFEQAQRREAVLRALGHLSLPFRQVLMLRYFEQLSYEEIAVQTRQPLGTVKNRIHRAKGLLRHRLAGREGWL
jgi:RNA polymerase sigma-70 factor (ECF subfamily)